MKLRPAVFLDKDGTLVVDVPFNADPLLVRLAPGAGEGLARLQREGYALVLVSNQPGVALGRFPAGALAGVTERIGELLAPHGVALDGAYYCPHAPASPFDAGSGCTCRKPAPGLLFRAARDLGLHLRRSWMIGDILHDVEAGRAAGCRTILIENGGETEWRLSPCRIPHFTATDLLEAAEIVERAGTLVAPRTAGGAA